MSEGTTKGHPCLRPRLCRGWVWGRGRAGVGAEVEILNRSADWRALSLNGPRARDILGACTPADLSNAGFRWLAAQAIDIAGHRLRALCRSCAGALGWECHGDQPGDHTACRAIRATGRAHGSFNYGPFAMNVMCMDKGFKTVGELTNAVTLPESGVMHLVKFDKELTGKTATRAALERGGPRWRCICLDVAADGRSDGNGGEAVLSNGRQVGRVSATACDPSAAKLLALA